MGDKTTMCKETSPFRFCKNRFLFGALTKNLVCARLDSYGDKSATRWNTFSPPEHIIGQIITGSLKIKKSSKFVVNILQFFLAQRIKFQLTKHGASCFGGAEPTNLFFGLSGHRVGVLCCSRRPLLQL